MPASDWGSFYATLYNKQNQDRNYKLQQDAMDLFRQNLGSPAEYSTQPMQGPMQDGGFNPQGGMPGGDLSQMGNSGYTPPAMIGGMKKEGGGMDMGGIMNIIKMFMGGG